MRVLQIQMARTGKPAYLLLADTIRDQVMSGQLQPGEWLPSTRALGEMLSLHRQTVMEGLQELVAEGWITAFPKRGYQVVRVPPGVFFQSRQTEAHHRHLELRPFRHEERISNSFQGLSPIHTPEWKAFPYAFQSGLSDIRLFPIDEWKAATRESLKKRRFSVLGFGDPHGLKLLREEMKIFLRRTRGVAGREVMITYGSQEALAITGLLYLDSSSSFAAESLGFSPAWQALGLSGATRIPIALDSDGMIPSKLEEALIRAKKGGRPIRLVYLTPLHQYPTTVTMPVGRRAQIYGICRKHDVLIVEDDYDHEFHYRSSPLAPLVSSDPDERVIYVSTLSKVLYPSARIGFVAVPEAAFEKFSALKRILNRQNDGLIQDTLFRWMKSGGFERHLRRMRRVYQERRDALDQALRDYAEGTCWQVPDGGMALWLNLKRNSDRFVERAQSRGVWMTSESRFGKVKKPQHLRLGFANQTPEELRKGIQLVFKSN